MHQSTIKVEIKMPIYLRILQKQFHIKTISSCSFTAWELSAWYFTSVVEKTPTSTGTVHPTIRRNIQENCAVILPITESICCAHALDLYSLLRRPRQAVLPGGRATERGLCFYLALLKLKHHLRGRYSSNSSTWPAREQWTVNLIQTLFISLLP